MAIIWYTFELVGTIAFAISGALVGISRRMDIFGVLVLACSTAIGGGILRDILVGRIPPNSLQSSLYIILTMVVTGILFLIYRISKLRHLSTRRFRKTYLIADALGLASFTVTGVVVGLNYYPEMTVFAIILGLLTAVGGGIIRDLLAQRIPSVLREEVYAIPSIVGGSIYCALASMELYFWASYISFGVVFIIRMMAVEKHWNLPKVHH